MNFQDIFEFENILDIEFYEKYSNLECNHCNMPFICNFLKKQIYLEVFKLIYKKKIFLLNENIIKQEFYDFMNQKYFDLQ